MGYIKNLITTIFFVLLSLNAQLQDHTLNVQFYGIEEGLSHRNTLCIYKDHLGFMWFGTQYGLNRFDGYKFKWFTKEKNGLIVNRIDKILGDKDGLMWLFEHDIGFMSFVKSITLFDPETHIVRTLEEKFGNALPFTPKDIIGFTGNEYGHLAFISKKNKLIIYTGKWLVFPVNLGDMMNFHELHWAPDGKFWIIIKNKDQHFSLIILDNEGKKRHHFHHSPSHYLYVYELNKDGTGEYLTAYNSPNTGKQSTSFLHVGTNGKQSIDTSHVFNKSDINFHEIGPLSIIHESQDHYWIITDQKKFNVIDKKTVKTLTRIEETYANLRTTNEIFVDNNQFVWIGTQFGIYQFQLENAPFKKHLHDTKEKGDNELFATRQISVDHNDHLWVRTENPAGVWKVDLKTGKYGDISTKFSTLPPIPDMGSTGYSIYRDTDENIIYYRSPDIYKVDPLTHEYSAIGSHRGLRRIWTFYEDQFNRLWFYDQQHNEMGYVENDIISVIPEQLSLTENLNVYQVFEYNNRDTVWVVTNGGLITFDVKAQKVLNRYWSGGKGSFYFPYDNLYHIYPDQDGTCWIASGGAGLIHVALSIQGISILDQYTRADGLSNNTIYAVYEDDFGNLWMPSDYGICEFNKESKRFRGYTEKDGITHNEFNRVSHFQDEKGNLYFGGLKGITAFHPKDFVGDTLVAHAPLIMTAFEQFDGDENKLIDKLSSLRQNMSITIRPSDRFFLLQFALLTYNESDKVQYAYSIEGIDNEWNYQQENTLRISTLPYGRHTLKIKGQAANGEWSENELEIKLNVVKPFYLQTWFLTTAILSLLLGVYLFYWWRVGSLKARQVKLEQIVKERTWKISEDKKVIEKQAKELQSLDKLKSRFFANVSHELRTPLTLMLGPINSLIKRSEKNKTDYKLLQFLHRNSKQLQKLINEILDLSKLENNKLEIIEEEVVLYPYLKEQMAQFHSRFVNEQLQFELKFLADKSLKILLDKNKFEKIIHNFISNAIKFTPPDGNVTLSVTEASGDLQLEVKDNGKGIHPDDLPHVFDRFYQSKYANVLAEGGTGIGLSLCKELAELLGGCVWAESRLGEGSNFYFKFPKKTSLGITPEEEATSGHIFGPTDMSHVAEETTVPEAISAPLEGAGKTTILIVDDNRDMRNYLQFILSDYQVITAENGKNALDKLNDDKAIMPDLIISDLMMPVMDGFKLLESLKSEDRWRHLPTIMLTAKANIRSKLKALRIGVDDYLTKPFQEDELKARIENLLHNYRERMAIFSSDQNGEKKKAVIAQVDAEWLEEVENIFVKNIDDYSFSIDRAAETMHLSTRQFQRKLKKITGLTPIQYLHEMRFQKARDFLLSGKYNTVKETAYATGFRDVQYFSKMFRKHFAVTPSSLMA